MVDVRCRWPVILLAVLLSPAVSFSQQQVQVPDPRGGVRRLPLGPPLPEGQRITAGDGDTVVIEGDARVRIIRRRPAFVRIIANVEQRFVIVVTENLREYGDSPTRLSDRTYEFNGLHEQWPFAPRWEGTVWFEEYSGAGAPPGGSSGMVGLETPDGMIVFASRGPARAQTKEVGTTAGTITVGFGGIVMGGGGQQPFDQEETRALAQALQNAARRAQGQGTMTRGPGIASWSSMSSGSIGPAPPGTSQATNGAVRVGGNVSPPRKTHHVDPVMPEQARTARIAGTVIVEITIGTDGAVTQARILRSIPLLDQPALDAVKQWRYEPTVLNGQAVPVIMTATVSFGPA